VSRKPVSRTPSVKGSVFSTAVEMVEKLIAHGEVTREGTLRWLEPEDLELLESRISLASWYDVRAYDRLSCLLRDVAGGGRDAYLRDLGRETGRRLGQAGVYSQLEYLHRTQLADARSPEERFEAFGRDLKRLTTLSASILNFSVWSPKPDPEQEARYVIEVTEAEDFPDTLAWRSDGFVNHMASQHGEPDLWTWSRPHADLILFRMNREV